MNQVHTFLRKFYAGLRTPLGEQAAKLLAQGEWEQLQKLTPRAMSSYSTAQAYYDDARVAGIAKKLMLPGDRDKRRSVAVDNFWRSERQCYLTNRRLIRFVDNFGLTAADEPVLHFINAWRKEIKRVLGRVRLNMEPRFSGGSTLSDSGNLTTIPDKMSSVPTCYTHTRSEYLLPYRFTILDKGREPVRANRFFTVPKDSQKDRGCCMEASANLGLQLAVGRQLKERYRYSYGVDLVHAQPLHRELAQYASETGEFATIDLSNASDTVSRELVRLLVPPAWYELLDNLRARCTSVDGKIVHLEKFSSMGNGFTFELETIIFRSLITACGHSGYVFGDDIIVPSEGAADVLAALSYFGFTPNSDKTFCEGPFRESCGGDYFMGRAVRPHFMREIPDAPLKWIALANGVTRCNQDGKLNAAWRYCVDQIPTAFRVFGPEALGDSVIRLDTAEPQYGSWTGTERDQKVVHGPMPYWWAIAERRESFALEQHWKPDVAIAASLLGTGPRVTPRGARVTGYKRVRVPAYGVSGM